MGGLITTAARFKDNTIVSFRHYTCNNFNLILDQDSFIKEMKRSCPSAKISPKRLYTKFHDNQVIAKYNQTFSKTERNYVYGNTFLSPFGYGMNFYDYKRNVAFSVNGFSNNLNFLTYSLMLNPIMIKILKEGIVFTENDLERFSHNIPSFYLNEIIKFKELKNRDVLFDLNRKHLELSHMDTFDALLTLFGNRLVRSECFQLICNIPEWQFHSFDDEKEGFNLLRGYLENERLLTKNDKIAWDLFYSGRDYS